MRPHSLLPFALLPAFLFDAAFHSPASAGALAESPSRASDQCMRVPAEWEPHAATWMQWPRGFETSYRPNMSDVIDAIQAYEPVHILVRSADERSQARSFLDQRGVDLSNLTWHIEDYNWAWMRDNGPIWVERGGKMHVQNWGFDGWGGLVDRYALDDGVPCRVAAAAGVACEDWGMIDYEGGAFEFNGRDVVIASWSVMEQRNPGLPLASAEKRVREAFGVTKVVWLQSFAPDDLTRGHVDSVCRFIDEDTVVVGRFVDQSDPNAIVYEEAAGLVAAAGLNVVRMDIPGYVNYQGLPMYAVYVNWLVANDVVVLTGFGEAAWDRAARATVQSYFPGRDVIVVPALEMWYWGGGVHCMTNHQPLGDPGPGSLVPEKKLNPAARRELRTR